jgi:hypothetical protein
MEEKLFAFSEVLYCDFRSHYILKTSYIKAK